MAGKRRLCALPYQRLIRKRRDESGTRSAILPGLVRLLPLLDARARLLGGILQVLQIRRAVTVAGLPLILLLLADFKSGRAKGALGTVILPDAHMDRAFMEFVGWLAARSG
jgi:hypothetical protein